jgi:hypothetical protein
MKYWLVVVQWMVLATAMVAPARLAEAAISTAQTNTPTRRSPAKPPGAVPAGNRFLFILETSAAMNRLEHGGRQAIFDLLYSGIDGRMRNGDTYGIWTFNELPYAGFYPMQTWTAQQNLEHATGAGRFLKTQKYEKSGNLTNLLKHVQSVVRTVKDLNVIIVTDANTPASGTPFDAEINEQYRTNAPQVRETKRPLITTLTARAGSFTASCVTLAGEKIVLADLPPQTNHAPKVEVVSAAKPTATNEASPPAIAPKKPLGQVVAISDVEAEAERAKLTNGLSQAAGSEKVRPAFVEHTNAVVLTTNAAPVTNEVEQSVIQISPAVTATPSNALATATAEVAPTAAMRVSPTNESPSHAPEPLPAVVPAQIKVSAKARTAVDQPVSHPSIFPANLMLILGGAFVGASVVGGLMFLRRVREPRQPSFISQGMQRK